MNEKKTKENKKLNNFQKKADKNLKWDSFMDEFKELAEFLEMKSAFLRFLGDGLSIKDLEVIIKNNFTKGDGVIDISGMRFSTDVIMIDCEFGGVSYHLRKGQE
jgi:hypothetical protein